MQLPEMITPIEPQKHQVDLSTSQADMMKAMMATGFLHVESVEEEQQQQQENSVDTADGTASLSAEDAIENLTSMSHADLMHRLRDSGFGMTPDETPADGAANGSPPEGIHRVETLQTPEMSPLLEYGTAEGPAPESACAVSSSSSASDQSALLEAQHKIAELEARQQASDTEHAAAILVLETKLCALQQPPSDSAGVGHSCVHHLVQDVISSESDNKVAELEAKLSAAEGELARVREELSDTKAQLAGEWFAHDTFSCLYYVI